MTISTSTDTLDTGAVPNPTCWDLFLGFLEIGIYGFGGVGATAHYVIVEKRRWLSPQDYLALLSIGQVLPGGNIVNSSVILGDRLRGLPGVAACTAGLMIAPLAILIALGLLYDAFGTHPVFEALAAGGGAAASGLVIGTGLRLARSVAPSWTNMGVGLLALVALGVLRVPLPLILVVLLPASIGIALWRMRR